MIAEICGKISSDGSNLSERLEDQLTGNIFGALRYIDCNQGIIPVLNAAYYLHPVNRRGLMGLAESPTSVEVQFWPWICEAEPDVMITLEYSKTKIITILIEVKYRSGLSSDDNCIANSEAWNNIDKSNNQLIRQMRGMQLSFSSLERNLVYLTADYFYPFEIMTRVRKQADEEDLKDVGLYWLSWHDIPSIIVSRMRNLSKSERIISNDLKSLLDRKGFGRFSEVERLSCSPPSSARYVIAKHPMETRFTGSNFSSSDNQPFRCLIFNYQQHLRRAPTFYRSLEDSNAREKTT